MGLVRPDDSCDFNRYVRVVLKEVDDGVLSEDGAVRQLAEFLGTELAEQVVYSRR